MDQFVNKEGFEHLWTKVKDELENYEGKIPVGGKAGQVLTKRSYDDYDVYWADVNGGVVPPLSGHVFGVMWDSSNPNTALTRLTRDNDPHKYVNTNITEEPIAGVGSTIGSSQFDNYLPWSGMEEYNIVDNEVSYKRGQVRFSRTLYDTMVYIPEFYCKVIQDGAKWFWYISNNKIDGFEKHPGSGRYVGRYNTGAGYVSKSGLDPLTGITRTNARTNIHAKGANWWQYDYATWCAIWLLYLVEYADWNSQTKIGRGVVDSNAVIANGNADAMSYHTGRADGVDGKTAVQYRWIENPWGVVFDIVDGLISSNKLIYVSLDNSTYQDQSISGYTSTGVTTSSSGWIAKLGYSNTFPWAFIPTAVGGGANTYITDQAYISTTLGMFQVGGGYSNGNNGGLFCYNTNFSATTGDKMMGTRLIYIPTQME